jgi:hypothetical protein
MLANVASDGIPAVEIDSLHPDYCDEDAAVSESVEELNRLIANVVQTSAAAT